jgi:hypothetical protein
MFAEVTRPPHHELEIREVCPSPGHAAGGGVFFCRPSRFSYEILSQRGFSGRPTASGGLALAPEGSPTRLLNPRAEGISYEKRFEIVDFPEGVFSG